MLRKNVWAFVLWVREIPEIPSKFPTKFSKFPKKKTNSPTSFCRSAGRMFPCVGSLKCNSRCSLASRFGICVADITFHRGNVSTFHVATAANVGLPRTGPNLLENLLFRNQLPLWYPSGMEDKFGGSFARCCLAKRMGESISRVQSGEPYKYLSWSYHLVQVGPF